MGDASVEEEKIDLLGYSRLTEIPDLSGSSLLKKIVLHGCSRLTKIQNLSNLTLLEVIDLHGCSRLTGIPDLSRFPLLETIDLYNCKSLLDFPLLAPRPKNLRGLDLKGCESLRSFPNNIHFESLYTLNLNVCINFITFPKIFWNLSRLDLSETTIDEVPPSIENLIKLSQLGLPKSIWLISTNICKLKSLKELNLENCSQDLAPYFTIFSSGIRAISVIKLLKLDIKFI